MIHPTKEHIDLKGSTTAVSYIRFGSITDFHSFVKDQMGRLNPHNAKQWQGVMARAEDRLQLKSEWYGFPIPRTLEELDTHNYFLGMHLTREIAPKIKERLAEYLKLTQSQTLPKPKLAHNDKGLGIFSFDRAIMGMYRVQPTAKDTPIEKITSQLKIELDVDNKATTIKNVFTHFENRSSTSPVLQLYVVAGANAKVQGKQLLYIGLALAELVAFMELRGVATEVNLLIGTHFDTATSLAIVRMKGFEDPIDTNQLLLLSSDPRYYRYRGFKALMAINNYLERDVPPGLGRLHKGIGKEFIAAINPKRHAVFEQSYAMDDAVKEVTEILTRYTKNFKR
ncbi:hypothetical protein [Aquimarina latercula]|uniref:hypothetical protein n=1 Tax=Aquimarina latercula TaxID=987 RepID=UPI00041DC385|nr:hypothetical protein [Aquimarina latercula]